MEKPEINLERIHLLIDKLKTQVSDSSGAEHLLSTAQMLVAELQTLQRTERPRPSVCVVMPSGTGSQRIVNQTVSNSTNEQTPQKENLDLQPPVTITEQPPEEVIDLHAFNEKPEQEAAAASVNDNRGMADAKPLEIDANEAETPSQNPSTEDAKQPPEFSFDSEVASETASANVEPAAGTEPEFPTSIPSDLPEIQPSAEETTTALEASTENTANNHTNQEGISVATPYRAPAPPNHQPLPIDNQEERVDTAAKNDQSAAASAPIEPTAGIPETVPETEPTYDSPGASDKKRQLDFIHENFSAWSDYGIVDEAPTLIQNKVQPASETKTQMDLNDQLNEDREEWGHTLQSTPIDNLAAVIGINDRYLFISELFRGDESMYERSILTLNKFQNFDQAHAWSERELRLKLGWDMENPITQQFEQLVKRRFMKKG